MEPKSWPDHVATWQEALERKWKPRLELWFLRLTQTLTWSYVAAVLIAWLLLHLAGDHWWAASLLLFGPRWIGLLPVLFLIPLALVLQPGLLRPIVVIALIFVFGVMGYQLTPPWRSSSIDPTRLISVVTCNVHGGEAGWDRFQSLMYESAPDIVAIQELSGDVELPFSEEWHVAREGQLVLASPHPIRDVQKWYRHEPPTPWPPLVALSAIVDCPEGPVTVCNVHFTSPHDGITEALDRHTLVNINRTANLKRLNHIRQQESAAVSKWIGGLPDVDIVLGDFNLPVESRIYKEFWSNYRNAFSESGVGVGSTRWVLFHNFQYGVRIDHILTSDAWHPITCRVGRDIGSDHLPLVAQLCPSAPGT